MAPRNALSVSSRNSWKDTTVETPGVTAAIKGWESKAITGLPCGRHLRCPPCPRHPCPTSPGPAGCSADGQTNTHQPLPRLAPRIPTRRRFPTEKTAGKEKQKRETTIKTPLSPSQGTDATESPAPRDGKCSASSHPARARRDEGAGGRSPPPRGTAPSQRAPGTRPFAGVLPRHPFS